MKRANTAKPLPRKRVSSMRRTPRRRLSDRSASETVRDVEALTVVPVKALAARPTSELGEETRLSDTAHKEEELDVPSYEVIGLLEDTGDRDFYLARKKSKYAVGRTVMLQRVLRSEPDFEVLERRLIDEGSVIARFDHPNVVGVVELGGDRESVFLALEHVEGASLQQLNQTLRGKHRALPCEVAAFLALEALRGVQHVHGVKASGGTDVEVVLRDLTPRNLLISRTGQVKLLTLGLAPALSVRPTVSGPGICEKTCAYLAPESIEGGVCSVRSDVYTLGVVLFELISGRECFSGKTAIEVLEQIVGRGVPHRELEREGAPEDLVRIVRRATAPAPSARFATAREMADAIEEWLAHGRTLTPAAIERFIAKHALIGGTTPPPEGGGPVPALRVVRGRSAVVKEATGKVQVTSTVDTSDLDLGPPKGETRVLTKQLAPRVAVERRSPELEERNAALERARLSELAAHVEAPPSFEPIAAPIVIGRRESMTPSPFPDGALPLVSIGSQVHEVAQLARRPFAKRKAGAVKVVEKFPPPSGSPGAGPKSGRIAVMRRKRRVAIALRLAIFALLMALLTALAIGLVPIPELHAGGEGSPAGLDPVVSRK